MITGHFSHRALRLLLLHEIMWLFALLGCLCGWPAWSAREKTP
jgi:hypothetical protein